MKTLGAAVLMLAALGARAQSGDELANERVYQFQQQRIAAMNAEIQQELDAEAADNARRAAIQQRAAAIQETLRNYPWRIVDGITQHVDVTWCVFSGRVLQSTPDGVRVQGEYASIYPDGAVSFFGEFFVRHFPYSLADGDNVPPYVAGMPAPVYTYTTVMGGDRTIHSLDFGIPCDEPAWAVEAEAKAAKEAREAAAARAAAEKVANERNILIFVELQATNGDANYQCELGERYMQGNGVPLDKNLGQMWLQKAELGGNAEASNYLQHFNLTNSVAASGK